MNLDKPHSKIYVKELTLVDYMRYSSGRKTLFFDERINVLLGNNGSGKTFLLNLLRDVIYFSPDKLNLDSGIEAEVVLQLETNRHPLTSKATPNIEKYRFVQKISSSPIAYGEKDFFSTFQIVREIYSENDECLLSILINNKELRLKPLPEYLTTDSVLGGGGQLRYEIDLPNIRSPLLDTAVSMVFRKISESSLLNARVLHYCQRLGMGFRSLLSVGHYQNWGCYLLPPEKFSQSHDFDVNDEYLASSFQLDLKIRKDGRGWMSSGEGGLFSHLMIEFLSNNAALNQTSLLGADREWLSRSFSDWLATLPVFNKFFQSSRFVKVDIGLARFEVEPIQLSPDNPNNYDFKINCVAFVTFKDNFNQSCYIVKGDNSSDGLGVFTGGEKRYFSLLVFRALGRAVFFIDEIENGLHPSWIAEVLNSKEEQLFISTHNPYVINNVQQLSNDSTLANQNIFHICQRKNEGFDVHDLSEGEKELVANLRKKNIDTSSILNKLKIW